MKHLKLYLKLKILLVNSNSHRKIHETKLPHGGNQIKRQNKNEYNPIFSAQKVNEHEVGGMQGSNVFKFCNEHEHEVGDSQG